MTGALIQLFADNIGAFFDAAVLLSILAVTAGIHWIRRLG